MCACDGVCDGVRDGVCGCVCGCVCGSAALTIDVCLTFVQETCGHGGLHTYLTGAATVLFSRFSVRKAAHAQSTPPWEKRCDATRRRAVMYNVQRQKNLLLKASRVHSGR